MRPRDPAEDSRAASSLGLFFDLVFIIAVSNASTKLHDTVTAGHLGDGLIAQQELFVVFVLVEVTIPVFAESHGTTPWHPHRITERYGCFTIIVLGESLLTSANAVFGALEDIAEIVPLVSLGVLSLIVTAAMWWICFWPPHHRANAGRAVNTIIPTCAGLVLLDPIIPIPTFLVTCFMIIIVVTLIVASPKDDESTLAEVAVE